MERKHNDAIVYAWAKREVDKIGGMVLGSCFDTYDTEYGWTAEDFERASGGAWVHFYTVGINSLSLSDGEDTEIAVRLKHVPDRKEGGGPVVLYCRGDTVILHACDKKILDIGKYGIFDTLKGVKLHASPNERDDILDYDGAEVYFIEDRPPDWALGVQYFDRGRFRPSVFKVNLDAIGRNYMLRSAKVPKGGKVAKLLRRKHEELFRWRYLSPFSFDVDGKKYTVENKRLGHSSEIESSRILNDKGEIVWEEKEKTRIIHKGGSGVVSPDNKYIVAAIGFPEDVIKEYSAYR